MREIILDTETTGLETSQDHRIIEIGAVELVNRRLTGRHFHQYINPQRDIDEGAQEVHGISREFLQDKPVFHLIADEFLDFIRDAQLVIHNAPFDIGFLNHEFSKLEHQKTTIREHCSIVDTLAMARQMHPGQKNNLDALCKRYFVDNSQRDLHGALLDAEILADVYLAMTGGQVSLSLKGNAENGTQPGAAAIRRLSTDRTPLVVIGASKDDMAGHVAFLDRIDKQTEGQCLWSESSKS